MTRIVLATLVTAAALTTPSAAEPYEPGALIRPPVITYPPSAVERGITGECKMLFDVDARGKPYNITAQCTNRVFTQAAIRAVTQMEYAPYIVNGQAVERMGMIYPIVFALN